jgi:hypothetical protein
MYRYVGNGWIHGVPARDLSDEEAKKYGIRQLLESGLYIKVIEKSEVKDGNKSVTQDTART